MTKARTLNEVDWIQAGFRALTHGGVQALKVEAIARDLRVSKGSFYWHFKDVAALKQSMLAHWQQVATEDIVASIKSTSSEPREQLLALLDVLTSDITRPYGGRLVEAAIRQWARYDQPAETALQSVDQKRMRFLTGLFQRLGAPRALGKLYASTIYSTMIGVEQVSHKLTVDRRKSLKCLVDLMLSSTELRHRKR